MASAAGLVHVFAQAVMGRRATVSASLRVGVRRMWSMLGVGLLMVLIMVAVMVPLILAIVLALIVGGILIAVSFRRGEGHDALPKILWPMAGAIVIGGGAALVGILAGA